MKPVPLLCSLVLMPGLMLTSAGCASVSLAVVGTALGVVGSAASSGSSVYHLGKLDDVFLADYEQTRQAVVMAADDLQFRFLKDQQSDPKKNIWVFQLADDMGSKTTITVQRRSNHLCRCRVDVDSSAPSRPAACSWTASAPTSPPHPRRPARGDPTFDWLNNRIQPRIGTNEHESDCTQSC